MQGKVLDFSIQTNSGLISGDDNKRYKFDIQEWKDASFPQKGDQIDFEINPTNGEAVGIYLMVCAKKPNVFTEPLKSDESQYNIIDWSKKCLMNYANFEGRARRKEFWFFYLAVSIISSILNFAIGDVASGIWSLAMFVPVIAVGSRRLHDIDRSGWWQLLPLTIVGGIVLIVFLATDTKQENNKWGKPAR